MGPGGKHGPRQIHACSPLASLGSLLLLYPPGPSQALAFPCLHPKERRPEEWKFSLPPAQGHLLNVQAFRVRTCLFSKWWTLGILLPSMDPLLRGGLVGLGVSIILDSSGTPQSHKTHNCRRESEIMHCLRLGPPEVEPQMGSCACGLLGDNSQKKGTGCWIEEGTKLSQAMVWARAQRPPDLMGSPAM